MRRAREYRAARPPRTSRAHRLGAGHRVDLPGGRAALVGAVVRHDDDPAGADRRCTQPRRFVSAIDFADAWRLLRAASGGSAGDRPRWSRDPRALVEYG